MSKNKHWQPTSKSQPPASQPETSQQPKEETMPDTDVQNPHEQAHPEPVSVHAEPTESLEDVLADPTVGLGDAPQAPSVSPSIEIDLEAQRALEASGELVPIVPRKNVSRSRIGGAWYTFVKGREVFVPRSVADHLFEKGIL